MNTKKKIFSNNTDLNFSQYLKNKNGIEILKNLQSKKTNTIDYFLSYDDFILLTKTYFNYLYLDTPCSQVPTNLYESNTSFMIYEKLLSHLKDCNKCLFSKDILQMYDCKELIGILYPYGEYIENNLNSKSSDLFLHSKINIDKFCVKEEKKKNCKYCIDNKKENTENMYPSQNNFIFDINENIDNFEKHSRMNAYAVYPFKNNVDINTSLNSNIESNSNTDSDYLKTNTSSNIESDPKMFYLKTNTSSNIDPIPNLPVKIKTDFSNLTNFNRHKLYNKLLQSQNNDITNAKNDYSFMQIKQPDYNTCLKMIKSKSPYEMYYRPKENMKKSIIPIKKNGKKN